MNSRHIQTKSFVQGVNVVQGASRHYFFFILRVSKMANILIFFCLRSTHSFEKLTVLRAFEAQG